MNRVKRNSTKAFLQSVEVPKMEEGSTYIPISHSYIMELTEKALEQNEFEVVNDYYLAARDGKQAIGKYSIKYGSDPDMGLMIAWNNSYDKSTTLKWGIGAHVFVCSNGMITSDMNFLRRKHMGSIEEVTVKGIAEYTRAAGNTFREMIENKERMKEVRVSKRVSAEIAGRLFIEENIITTTQLGIMKKEIENPSFNYGEKDSMWELYNHATFAIKQEHPQYWMEKHLQVNDFFVNKSGLLLPIEREGSVVEPIEN